MPKSKKKVLIEVFLLLDESSSMQPSRMNTIAGVNSYIKETRAKLPYARLTIAKFAASLERVIFGNGGSGMRLSYIYQNQPIGAARLLEAGDYNPNGNTPLRDAQAEVIHYAMKTVADGVGVLFVTFTDGEENCSVQTSAEELATLIANCRKQQWEFVYFGANQDAASVAQEMGMSRGNSQTYDVKDIGAKMRFAADVTNSYAMNYSKGLSVENLVRDTRETGGDQSKIKPGQ